MAYRSSLHLVLRRIEEKLATSGKLVLDNPYRFSGTREMDRLFTKRSALRLEQESYELTLGSSKFRREISFGKR